jgi:hypothetical protein
VNAYPNPFNSTATIEFMRTDESAHAVVEVYGLSGNKVATLFDSDIEQGGVYNAVFNGDKLDEGVYMYRIISSDKIINGKLILIK